MQNTVPPEMTGDDRATLDAVVRTVLPHLFGDRQPGVDVTALVEYRLAAAPRSVSHDLALALKALGNPVLNGLVSGRWQPFSRQPEGARAETLDAWARSAFPPARSASQALRRFVLSTWYATVEGREDIGVLPPLNTRAPQFDWEGPVEGEPAEADGPVLRRARTGWRVEPVGRLEIPPAVLTAATLRGDQRLTADAIVIGSGAGGAVAAARLAEAGREVVIVESGEYLHARDFNELEGDLVPRLYADQALRTTIDGSFSLLQGGAVGGGTTVNWMLMLRPHEETLEAWSRMGIPGFGVKDLAPHLDRIEAEVHARLVPADAHAPSNRVILDGARALGWRATAAAINARDCIRAGSCSLGCRYDAKQSGLLTYLPRAFSAGARLYANAHVERVEVLERDHPASTGTPPLKRVTAVVVDPGTGERRAVLTLEAPVVVLAAGAVGTPVILEKSGLGGGGVGRHLWLHPTTAVMGRYPGETYPIVGIPQSALCDEFLRRDANGHGFWLECPALQPALAAAALPGFGPLHRAAMTQLRNTVALIVLVRDGSGSDRSMGAVWVDRRGYTRIRYRMTPADRANARAGVEAAARLHLAAGADDALSLHTPPVHVRREVDLPAMGAASVAANRMTWFSAHVNGTCRLGANPATSGVTPDAERHGVRGLYVCDGSLLPTSLGVNPQETIMAMASLVAERMTS